ncbi:MAG TPA: M12 family metallo-peptidase [Jiangellales bacterium]|nr:M12 family metallo-peptidase [Jiangellales bacterium]
MSAPRPLVALAALAVTVAVAAAGLPAAGAAGPPTDVLPEPARGAAAVAALGDRLPAVAALNGITGRALRDLLLGDGTAWLDRSGRLYYVEPPAPAGTGETDAAAGAGPYPYDQTFTLHSRPGAQRTIYLDFTGHVVTGTAWNVGRQASATVEPYDTDGNPASFSPAEMDVVQEVWQRVAEDYAPFDVDVTTEEPPYEAINRNGSTDQVYGTRVVISPTSFYYSSCSCGGVAYVGVFDRTSNHAYYQPAFVFTRGVGNGAKNIVEAASHEAGHNLGLSHDGTASTGYYSGHGAWAPIMGVGYSKAITQWSRGEYSGANNTQDDIAVMVGRGAPLRADDHGNTTGTATPLAAGTASASGVIGARTDVDVFSVPAGAGSLSVSLGPAAAGANLDAKVELLDAAGAVIASADPASGQTSAATAFGLGASLTATVPAGTSYVRVDGVGFGSPLTSGYSDYGSLGAYTLSVTSQTGGGGGTPPPEVQTVRVQSIGLSALAQPKNKSAVRARVVVSDTSGAVQPGTTVTGSFSGAVSGTVTGVTGSDGSVTLQSADFGGKRWSVTFTVTSLARAGATYSPGANVVGSATISQ